MLSGNKNNNKKQQDMTDRQELIKSGHDHLGLRMHQDWTMVTVPDFIGLNEVVQKLRDG